VLPPALLFAAANKTIPSAREEGIEAGKHDVHVVASTDGWTNNDIGLA